MSEMEAVGVPLSPGFETGPCVPPLPICPWSNEVDGDPLLGEREGDFTGTYILNNFYQISDYKRILIQDGSLLLAIHNDLIIITYLPNIRP